MNEKTIGILGGMGPEATLNCFEKIINNTPAEKDQDHLRIIIDSNPKIPDRTNAILGKGPSPVSLMLEGCRNLQNSGANFIIIPCISAHYFLKDLQKQLSIPVISIFDVVSRNIAQHRKKINIAGLLGTTGTIKGGLFQERLKMEGIDTVVCNSMIQEKVMAAIYTIKKTQTNDSRKLITNDLVEAAQSLVKSGAQGIIAGCTEIPLALSQKDIDVPYFDALLILARNAIISAGIKPIPIDEYI